MNQILADYGGGTPAKYSFTMQSVYSASQLEFGLDVGYTGPAFDMSAHLGVDWGEEKSRLIVKLSQKFFTMVFDDPEGPAGVFAPGFDAARLAPYTGPGNPVTYISSVTYGRMYYLLFESSLSHLELETALNLAYSTGVSDADLDARATFEEAMAQTTVSAWQIGGDPEAGLDAADPSVFQDWSAVKEFITQGANFSPTNIGEPISYTIKYLNDASLVRMNNTMEYTVEQCAPFATESKRPDTGVRFHLDKVEVVGTADLKLAGDGGVEVYVSAVDKVNGENLQRYHTPTNQSDRPWYRLVANGFQEGQSWNLGWTAPQFLIERSADWGIRIRFWGHEWLHSITGGAWSNGNAIVTLDFDPASQLAVAGFARRTDNRSPTR